MIKRKTTLVVTAVMLLLSIILLTTASLAWYTISTSPEISGMRVTLFTDRALLVSADGTEFKQHVSLSEINIEAQYYAPLKPISTLDGEYWFIPQYNADGTLKDPSEFKLATDENKNVLLYEKEVDGDTVTYTPLTGDALEEAKNNGYYVSFTFWLVTELDEDVKVTLSAPDISMGIENSNLESWETQVGHPDYGVFGSYALASYDRERDEDGNVIGNNVMEIDNNAQNALRVGFAIEADELNSSDRFVIYEPNADKRSVLNVKNDDGTIKFTKPLEENGYIHGFTLETLVAQGNYKDGVYIPTRPIKAVEDENGNIVGALGDIDPTNLIVQRAGSWNETLLKEAILQGNKPNSMCVSEFGKFIKNTSSLNLSNSLTVTDISATNTSMQTDLASQSMVVTLKGKNADGTLNPKKIEMYIWIEGQDVDCWNDIANGTFCVNLEFAAQEIGKNN